jgi:DNA-binding response OmpR family regulator
MTTVLVVDDEQNIRELVSVYLTAAGYSVEQAEDGAVALEKFDAEKPDLVLLDVMLPGIDGTEVCTKIREHSSTPIIMLSARDSDLDKVGMLESGADDYVTKPFSPPELVARVRAVLRRAQVSAEAGSDAAAAVVGGLIVDLSTREVSVDGVLIPLTTREFDLLYTMARRPGVVFTREQLLKGAIGFADFVDARGVDVHVRHIREKLGDDAAEPRFVETVRGVGYRVRKDSP